MTQNYTVIHSQNQFDTARATSPEFALRKVMRDRDFDVAGDAEVVSEFGSVTRYNVQEIRAIGTDEMRKHNARFERKLRRLSLKGEFGRR